MPELPDVEWLKRYFDATALHKTVTAVKVDSGDVLKNISIKRFKSTLKDKTFAQTRRHGKFLFAGFSDQSGWLVLHFGMTGDLKYYKKGEKDPEYDLVRFDFTNDYHLAYVMVRKLGELQIISDPGEFIKRRELGPDVFADSFTFESFQNVLAGRHGMIKPALMNQSIMAGIGNVYSDEILFQAGVHPETKVNQLDQTSLKKIFDEMQHVLQTAVNHKAQPDEYPDSFITPLRGEDDAECPRCAGKLKKLSVSGRSAIYCPDCQKKPDPS